MRGVSWETMMVRIRAADRCGACAEPEGRAPSRLLGSSRGWQPGGLTEQAGEADQVVGCRDQVAREAGAVQAAEARPTEAADRLHPAEDLLHALAHALAEGVAHLARGAAVDGAAAPAGVLGDVGCDL